MNRRTKTAALRGMIGHHVHIRRGDVRLVTGNLIGPLDMIPQAVGLWGAADGDNGRPTIYGFDPHDREISIELAA